MQCTRANQAPLFRTTGALGGRGARPVPNRTEVEGAAPAVGWAHLTSSGGGLFLHLVLLVDAIVAWVVGTSKSYLYE